MTDLTVPLPDGWRPLWDRAGVSSYRALGRAAGVSHEAARKVVTSQRTSRRTLERVAAALRVDPEEIDRLRAASGAPARGRWYPPAEADLLTDDERAALSKLIRLMVLQRRADAN